MLVAIAFGVGVVIGGILAVIILRSRVIGHLRVDNSDPDDGPYLFLELFKRIPNLCAKKYVMLKVKVENFISHE